MVFTQIKLQNHHAAEEQEDVAGGKGGDHLRKEAGEQGGEHPVSEAAQRLAFRPMAVGEDLGDEHPDHRALADRVRRDEREDAQPGRC